MNKHWHFTAKYFALVFVIDVCHMSIAVGAATLTNFPPVRKYCNKIWYKWTFSQTKIEFWLGLVHVLKGIKRLFVKSHQHTRPSQPLWVSAFKCRAADLPSWFTDCHIQLWPSWGCQSSTSAECHYRDDTVVSAVLFQNCGRVGRSSEFGITKGECKFQGPILLWRHLNCEHWTWRIFLYSYSF